MRRIPYFFILCALWLTAVEAGAQASLNPQGEPRYGALALAPGFQPRPVRVELLSGGDIDVKALRLGDNCLGYAARDPDFAIELAQGFERITFLAASEADSTLIISGPDHRWSCNDDSNGLNPALVFFRALPGRYRLWVGSYAPETFAESALYISESGPETLPTTATGPDPARAPLYGETSLGPGFGLHSLQILGGGRSQIADFVDIDGCDGFVGEAPDFSVVLAEELAEIHFGFYTRAAMTLLARGPAGSWRCAETWPGAYPKLHIEAARAGRHLFWAGSRDARNYAAGVFFASESAPDETFSLEIDSACAGQLTTELAVGSIAHVAEAAESGWPVHAAADTAATVLYRATPGMTLRLIGGPVCKDDGRWWRAENDAGLAGWLRDGHGDGVWLLAND